MKPRPAQVLLAAALPRRDFRIRPRTRARVCARSAASAPCPFAARGRDRSRVRGRRPAGGPRVDGAAVATFAGGCFWGLQLALDREPGVVDSCVGYTQGGQAHPTYAEVCAGTTGHAEAVLVAYRAQSVTYARLAEVFFDVVDDPTTLNRVGSDRGTQYRTGLYFHSAEQERAAREAFERESAAWKSSGRAVVTEVGPAAVFWPAEPAHQNYLARGGRFGRPQSAAKGCVDPIRCYG